MSQAMPALNLLIVDDEISVRSLLKQIFTQRGFAVRVAEDGFAALRMIRQSAPDVLLSDLNMPGMSGFELLSVVRRLYPGIHVIASSGAYSGTSVPRGIAADGFHEKATGLSHLFELISVGGEVDHTDLRAQRASTPQWVDLECRHPFESNHVLLNCPQCLRAFRQVVDEIHPYLREGTCRHCGGAVSYAIALAIKPSTIASCPTPQRTSARRP